MKIWLREKRENDQVIILKSVPVKSDAGGLTVLIGGVVVQPFIHIDAAGIDGFIIGRTHLYGTLHHGYGGKNVEELVDGGSFFRLAGGVVFGENGSDKAGRRGQIAREPNAAKPAGPDGKRYRGGKLIGRVASGERQVVG